MSTQATTLPRLPRQHRDAIVQLAHKAWGELSTRGGPEAEEKPSNRQLYARIVSQMEVLIEHEPDGAKRREQTAALAEFRKLLPLQQGDFIRRRLGRLV